jgi:hypothetical protein
MLAAIAAAALVEDCSNLKTLHRAAKLFKAIRRWMRVRFLRKTGDDDC